MSFDIMRELIELEGGSARLLNAEYSPARVIEVLLHAATTNQVGLSAGPSYTPIFELIQCIDSTLLDAAAMAAQAYSTYCMLEELRSKNNVSSLRHTLERAASNWTNALQANPTFALRARYLQRMRMSQQLAAIAMPLEYQLGFKIQIDDLRCKLQAARERLVLFHNNYLQAQNTRGVVSAARQTDAPPMGYQAALPPPLQLPHTPLHQQRQLQQIQWSHQQQQQQRYQPQPSPVQQSGLYAHQPPEPLVQSFGQQFAAHHPTQSSQQPQLPPPLSLNLPQTSSLSSHQAMSSASRVQPPAQVHQPVAAARYSNAQTSSTGASNYTSSSSSSSRQFISHTLASSPMSNSNITVSSSANVHAPQQNLGSQRSEQPHSNQAPPSASTTLLASITPAAGQQAVKQHLLEYARRYLQNSEVTAAQNARPVSTAGAQRQSRQPQPQPQPQPQQMSTSGFPTIPQTYIPPYLPRAPPEPVAGQPPNLRRVPPAMPLGAIPLQPITATTASSLPATHSSSARSGGVATQTSRRAGATLPVHPDRRTVAQDIIRALQGSVSLMQARAAAATPQPQPPQPPPVTGKRKRGKEAAAMMGMMDTFTVRSSLLPTASTSSSSTLPSTFPLPRPTPVVIGPASLSSPTPLRLNISSQTPAATVIPPNSMPRPPAQQVRRADEPADIELSTDDLIPRSPVASNIYKSHADGPPRSTGFVYDQPESVFPDPFFLAAGRVSPPRATIEEIETDDTLAPPLGEDTPQPKTRSLTPLFLDDRSPTRDGAQPFGIAIGDEAATSEDDVDAILHGSMRSDSPEIQVLDGPPAVPRVRRAPHTVQPEAGSSRAASRLSDPPRLPNSGPVRPVCHSWSYPKPDRVVVLVPVIRRPMIKPKTTSYVQFADFPTRGVLCKCEWNNCRAVLDCEDRLSLHMRKIHGQELPVSGRCEWKGCMQPFGRSVQFREHLESAHARNCLRCAYRDCSFQTSSGHLGALAEHVASTHATLGQQQLAAVVKPQLPLAPSPTLPLDRESVPPWRIGTVLVRPHVMTPARRNQLGNWVLAQSFARTDVDEVLPKKNSQARPRKDGSRDLSDVTVPLLSGIELELKQQYNWAEFEQTRKPRGIPASIQVGRVLEIA